MVTKTWFVTKMSPAPDGKQVGKVWKVRGNSES